MSNLWIDGTWVSGKGNVFTSFDPAKNAMLWEGAQATVEQVDAAVCGARKAFYSWSALTLEQRIDVIDRFTHLLTENKENIALAIAQETGKSLWEARAEAGAMLGKAEVSKQAYHERTGTRKSEIAGGQRVLRHRPHGVLAVFGPFNFPGHLPNGHIIPALLAGNTVVLKPSELTPRVAENMVKIWEQAGLPAGVIQLVQGQVDVGKALATHAEIDGILFTGSSKTGHLLAEQLSTQPHKILALEMGGNNPMVVGKITDLDAASYQLIQSAFITTGQRCTCSRRLFLPEGSQGDALLHRFTQMTASLRIGLYDAEPEPFMGSLISAQSAENMLHVQTRLRTQAKKVWLEMERGAAGSSFVTPAILEFASQQDLADAEYFGPLVQVMRYRDFEDAIVSANNTRYGLSAGLLSDDEQQWHTFYTRIRAGIVNWNGPTTGAAGNAPFGGIGASGNHRPSAYYAADYCAYPMASLEKPKLSCPETLSPGIVLP